MERTPKKKDARSEEVKPDEIRESHRATRADVAKRAGVSETRVSYVINDNRYVAKDKRERVKKAIEELNYHPNVIARALKKKTSKQILLITDIVLDEYFGEILYQLDKYAYDKDYLVSLCKYHNVDSYIGRVMNSQFDGIIINSAGFKTEYIRQLAGGGTPVVLFLSKKYEDIPKGVATIDSGLYDGVLKGLDLLWEKGARNIVYLAQPLKKSELNKDIRYLAFEEAEKRHGLSREKVLEQTFAGCDEDLWQDSFAKFLLDNPETDAIFTRNDRLAATASKIVTNIGRRIPEDIMILGVDNSSISRLMTPSITTIEQQKEEMSKTAIELIEIMNQGTKNLVPEELSKVFETRMIERESTKRKGYAVLN